MSPPPAVSVVVVSWNVCELLRACLRSVERETAGMPCDVWVVDNGSTDGSAAMVREAFPAVHLIENGRNPGFAAANNQGIRASAGRYVLLLNPDAELQEGSLSALCRYLDAHPRAAVAGPQLRNPDGSVQSSRRRAPRLATGFVESTQLQQYWRRSWLTDHYYVYDRPDDVEQEVEWLQGACLLVRRAAIDEIGVLDEGFRMYSEELEWCLRFRAAGWTVGYVPSAHVLHHGGQSSGQDVLARHFHHHQSKYRLYALRFGRPASLLLRLWIGSLYFGQLWEELAKLALLRRNRAMRRARLGIVARMALWHLTSRGVGER